MRKGWNSEKARFERHLYKKIRVMRAKEVEDNKHAVTRTLTLNYAY